MSFKQIMLQIFYCFLLALSAYIAYSWAIDYFTKQMELGQNSLFWRYFFGE